ncbi:MAG TPA: hypothetical protein V6D28_03105 [Leptolyngbyaceae cyanobacterium]
MSLTSYTKATINIGIDRHHPGIQGLTKSYQDARAALFLGRRLNQQNQVHCLAELAIAVFIGVSDEVTKMDLANHLLSPLEQEPDLLKTTEIFFSRKLLSFFYCQTVVYSSQYPQLSLR